MNAPVVLLRIDADPRAGGNHPRHRHPALDLKYMQAALAEKGIAAPLIDHTLEPTLDAEALAARALARQPRIAVVRAQTWNLEFALACARRLRAGGVVTVAVGQQVLHARRSAVPGWSDAYDHAIAGDAEAAAPDAILRLLAGAPLADDPRPHEIVDPDALPEPRFDARELAAYPFPFPLRRAPLQRWGYLLTAWGCPRGCRHCSVVVRKSAGTLLRARSIERVADEAARLADAGAQALAFEDDSLCVDRRRFLALCNALVRRNLRLPWIANARPDELDAERVAAAAASGAALLKVGVDCATPRLIERIGKARDGAAWIAAAETAFARLDAANVGSVALFMVGLPDETAEEAEASIELARRLRPDYVQVQVFTPYPDTALWAELDAGERARAGRYHYGAPTGSAAAAWQARFYRRFYFDPGFIARHAARHWRHYLSPRGLLGGAAQAAWLLRQAALGEQPAQREAAEHQRHQRAELEAPAVGQRLEQQRQRG